MYFVEHGHANGAENGNNLEYLLKYILKSFGNTIFFAFMIHDYSCGRTVVFFFCVCKKIKTNPRRVARKPLGEQFQCCPGGGRSSTSTRVYRNRPQNDQLTRGLTSRSGLG